jgi:dTDP-4-amino-4,6-dideoxygalactose transaminase
VNPLPIIRPDVTFDEVADDLRSVFDSGQLTSGPFLAEFEATLAGIVGVRHAVAVTSATTAIHLALHAAGVGPGDEVLISDFTFPATGNVVAQLGAVPVLVDSLADSFALDPEDAAAKVTPRTTAIVPVDPFGQPADADALLALADAHELVVVEDAACGLGGRTAGRNCGQWPTAGCFSFHPRKVVTTGEGGAVTTDDDDLAERLRRLRSHGSAPTDAGLQFVEHGFNYRLSEPSAVIGLAQLRRFDEILADRSATAAAYDERLAALAGVEVRRPGAGERWTHQSYVVMLDDALDRDAVVVALRGRGIETTLGTYALHSQPAFAPYGYAAGDLPNAWRAQRQSLTLPLLPRMDVADVDRVVEALGAVLADGVRRAA